jgi:hypothetical protein
MYLMRKSEELYTANPKYNQTFEKSEELYNDTADPFTIC